MNKTEKNGKKITQLVTKTDCTQNSCQYPIINYLVSDLKYQKVDKGVAISGSLATPTETIVFWVLKFNAIGMFRSL